MIYSLKMMGSSRLDNKSEWFPFGQGEFRNVYGSNGSNVTAGQQDYAERMNQIENQREDYYRKAGVAPGLPTMKESYADPEVTGKHRLNSFPEKLGW